MRDMCHIISSITITVKEGKRWCGTSRIVYECTRGKSALTYSIEDGGKEYELKYRECRNRGERTGAGFR